MRRGGRWSILVLAGTLAAWVVLGQSALARGGGHGGGGHWGGSSHFGGYPYRGFGSGLGYGAYLDFGGMGYPGYPGPINSMAPATVWTPWSWMTSSGYPGPTDGFGYGTAYGFPLGVFGYGSPYPDPDWPSGVIRRAPRHRGLRTVRVAPAVDPATNRRRYLGIEERPVLDPDGPGMEVVRVAPGTAAERAGLQVGDVIHSINGHPTQRPGDLYRIIHQAAPEGILNMSVRTASDGDAHRIIARLPW
jgi:membrane-associated protease RseP (regulator of RpoE activity)